MQLNLSANNTTRGTKVIPINLLHPHISVIKKRKHVSIDNLKKSLNDNNHKKFLTFILFFRLQSS